MFDAIKKKATSRASDIMSQVNNKDPRKLLTDAMGNTGQKLSAAGGVSYAQPKANEPKTLAGQSFLQRLKDSVGNNATQPEPNTAMQMPPVSEIPTEGGSLVGQQDPALNKLRQLLQSKTGGYA